jgi:hypothetical protein
MPFRWSLLTTSWTPSTIPPSCCTSIVSIGVALVFDDINGFHDAASSIATVVSTRVLSPVQAVIPASGPIGALAYFGTRLALK